MPPTLSPLFRLRLSALGEDLNSWGDPNLNNALKLIEEAVAGPITLTITGDRLLTADNFVSNEYRHGTHYLVGTPAADFVITVPPVAFPYRFVNRTGKQATIKTASGVAAVVRAGRTATVLCDGTDCTAIDPTLDQIKTAAADVPLAGNKLTGVGSATADDHAVNRGQLTSLTAASVQLASDWAQKIAGTVDGSGYSAKLWATSTSLLAGTGYKGAYGYANDASASASAAAGSANLAQSWATSTTVVSGGFKGALGYAVDASGSASAAAASAAAASAAQAVVGPSSSAADAIVLFNGTGGKTIKDGGIKFGTAPNNAVQLDVSSRLPPVDGSQLTGVQNFRAPDFIAEDQKPSGTDAGGSASNAYQTRVLNTTVRNSISGASLNTSLITLPAGSYYCDFDAAGYGCGANRTRLYNANDATTALLGSSEYASNSTTGGSRSYGSGAFTIASAKAFRIEQYTTVSLAANGLGRAVSSGDAEVYSRIRIWKTA